MSSQCMNVQSTATGVSGHGTSWSKLLVSAGDRELSPGRCSPVCRSEQRGVVAADQFLHRAAVTSQLCRDPRPVQTCTL